VLASVILARPSIGASRSSVDPSCNARVDRVGYASVHWISAWDDDVDTRDRWCRGVGPPFYIPTPAVAHDSPPQVEDLVIVTWNAHLSEGRLDDLVTSLREGALTHGQPVRHFVLLVQELLRRDADMPAFGIAARAARAIRAREDDDAADVHTYAQRLGLSMLYVPSMRNGAELFEDRGNAILSTEPLSQALAFELPFERQRRVAVGAAIDVMHARLRSTLRVIDVHLEPLSSPQSLWVFRNPRRRQVAAVLGLFSASRFEDDVSWVGTVLGGDFNTVKKGADESAYRSARAWSTGLVEEDRRTTHFLGRLDYLFFRLAPGVVAGTTRVDEKFGSDHHPVLGRFTPARAQ
jgi:endonuclease/exonuclease/phosphatase family metal-dependent hydrolase